MSRVRLLLAVLVAVGSALVLTGPARAATCSGASGVSVVVQFPDGHTETGCAPGDPSSGLAALQGAGFAYAFHPQNPGFVCKIKGLPADGNCMKPNYWAYFHSSGGAWQYSSVGAGSYDPAPGTTEGWRFGGGAAPSTAARPKPKPPASPTPDQPSGSGGAGTAGAGRSDAPATRSTPSASASGTARPSASATAAPRASGSPSRAGSASPGAVAGDDASPVSSPVADGSAGSGSLSWGWGLALAGVAVIVAGVVHLVRKSAT